MLCLVSSVVFANPIALIDRFEYAISHQDRVDYQEIWNELAQNSSAVTYMQANHPDLYIFFSKGPNYRLPNLSESSLSETEADRARNFPLQDREDSQSVIDDLSNQRRWDNGRIAQRFPNQNRPSNQEIIKQRQRQLTSREFDEELNGAEILLSVSGVNPFEVDALSQLLEEELGIIRSIKLKRYNAGVADYVITSSVNTEQLSVIIDGRSFRSFRLSLQDWRSDRLEFVLRNE